MAAAASLPAPDACAAEPRKPLYLATAAPVRVGALGTSLVVQREPGGRQFFPIARIVRVVCNRHAHWSGDALILCLRHGVAVTWLDAAGRAVGDAVPATAAPAHLHGALECLLERRDGLARYGNWLRSRRMDVLVRWAARLARAGRPPAPQEWEQRKREYVYGSRIPAVLADSLEGACRSLAASCLAGAGLRPRYWAVGGEPLELAADLAALLWAEVNFDCGTLAAGAADFRAGTLFFEEWAKGPAASPALHVAHLKRFVARELDQWP